MGTWGPGNLENDSALDELSDRTHEMVASLMERARSKCSRECDEYDYTTLFVDFEIIFALDARDLLECRLPTPAEVQALKRDYLREWEVNIDLMGPTSDFKEARRRCILRTFNRFKRICARKARQSADQAAGAAQCVVTEAPTLEELLDGVGVASCPTLRRLVISLPKTWTSGSSEGWQAAPDYLLVHRFVDPSSRRFIAKAMRIETAANGAAEAMLEDHPFDVQEVFFATGRSLVPDVPRIADPYILLAWLRPSDGRNTPNLHDLAFGAEEKLSPFYQGEGENVAGPYGIDTPEELEFLGVESFRRPPRGTPKDLYQHQNVYFHVAPDDSLVVLEYGSLGNRTDDFPDQILVQHLAATLLRTDANAGA